MSSILELFNDTYLIDKIKRKLPKLFFMAELESSRAGKVGMEVGSLREKILIALLIYKFGEKNIETEIPITEPEVDVKLFGKPLSIKTITGKTLSGVKLVWTVDSEKAKDFMNKYSPLCDILLVHINWNDKGGLYYIPVEIQREIFSKLSRERYIKLPKLGTNPRGIEISKEALIALLESKKTKAITINWFREKLEFNPYKKWVDLWSED